MKIGCIIQARNGSSRLPSKVLLPLPTNSNNNVLEVVVERVKKSRKLNEIIIATTDKQEDDSIENVATKLNVKSFRGDENNVLSRYYYAAQQYNLDIVVRITSDCPCIDAEVIDRIIERHLKNKNDYTSNTLERTFPHGLDAEVFQFSALEEAFINAKEKYELEHVTPYFYKANAEHYQIENVKANAEEYAPDIRITLDTNEDYLAIMALFTTVEYTTIHSTNLPQIYQQFPWLSKINESVQQKKIYDSLEDELTKAIELCVTHGLDRVLPMLRR